MSILWPLLLILHHVITVAPNSLSYNSETAYTMAKLSAISYADDIKPLVQKVSREFQYVGQAEIVLRGSQSIAFVAKQVSDKVKYQQSDPKTPESRKDKIFVTFRGTNNPSQLVTELAEGVLQKRSSIATGRVHPFFQDVHAALFPKLNRLVTGAKSGMRNASLHVTGHSLGGALAALFASQMVKERVFSSSMVHVITFGEPRVGDKAFAMAYDRLVPQTLRVVHRRDIIPHLPPCTLNPFAYNKCDVDDSLLYYYHHGTEVFYPDDVMSISSSYNICTGNPKDEDLECSNTLIDSKPCVFDLHRCINYHRFYFGMRMAKLNQHWHDPISFNL